LNSQNPSVEVHCSHDEMVDLFSLVPNPRNPNTHGQRQIELLAKIIKTYGWRHPIVVSKRSGFIVAGHGRREAALLLGLDKAPVDFQEYKSDAEEWAVLINDNTIAELAERDELELASLVSELGVDFDFDLLAMSDVEIAELMATSSPDEVLDDNFDVDSAIEEIKQNPTTQLGDIWILGKHRLICGDCTQKEVIEKLMDGDLAAMVFTDPPYNVNYESDDGKKIANDNMPAESFNRFLLESFSRMVEVSIPGAPIYVCHADSEGANFRSALIESGWLLKQCLIWVKNNFVIGRQDYQWKHEPILYGWKPGAAHKWYGKRKQSTVIDFPESVVKELQPDGSTILTIRDGIKSIAIKVPSYEVVASGDESSIWHCNKPLKSAEHPTMKPIPLCVTAIRNSSKAKDIVVDFFGGSGSTLMACEAIGRYCRTSELDPVYADVIVKRWELATGKKAKLIRTAD